jgi:hypothetical protein
MVTQRYDELHACNVRNTRVTIYFMTCTYQCCDPSPGTLVISESGMNAWFIVSNNKKVCVLVTFNLIKHISKLELWETRQGFSSRHHVI